MIRDFACPRALRSALFVLTAVLAFVATPGAFAAPRSVPATTSVITTVTVEGYDVDFTLPTNAKSGCMVCHGDTNLTRIKDDTLVSYWIDAEMVDASAHATVQCTGCHLDFAFKTPHVEGGTDWSTGARSACANCHLDQTGSVAQGAHRPLPANGGADPNAAQRPLCGDCHGSHAIVTITDSRGAQDELRSRAEAICGACHEEYWDNYNDYYHGAAFKRGAKDAPSCWDCHRAHDVMPADDKDSSVNERHLVETCAQCHPDANEAYVAYARLVHKRQDVADAFFLYRWISAARDAVSRLFGA